MDNRKKERKKILVTASTFPRWKGDSEPRFVLDLSEVLTKYYDVTVLAPAAPGAKESEDMNGVCVERYHYFPVHSLETLCYPGAVVSRIKEKKIRALLVPFLCISLLWNLIKRRKKYDIVFANWIIPQGILQSFLKKPYIVISHGTDLTTMNKGIMRKLKKKCLENALFVTVVSEHLRKIAEDLCPNLDVKVQSMGCRCEDFGPEYRVENYFDQNEKKVVLFVGRLVEIKGVNYLIEAMKLIDDAILVIVGSGIMEKSLKEQAMAQGNKIIFLGEKTHDELKTIYASADVFVAPSITDSKGAKEGFGLVIIEAMASGLPVVASNSGGIPDIIEDKYNGFLVPEKDVVSLAETTRNVLKDAELRRKIRNNSKKTVEKYNYKTIAQNYVKHIDTVEDKYLYGNK